MRLLRTILLLAVVFLLQPCLFAQPYTSFFTGDIADINTNVTQGTVLMGGAAENDNAMRWFLNRSGGGDIVVIRATGSNGYNNYLYSQLGVTVNSVETLIIPSVAAANDPYVVQQLQNAEAIWIAGGDQFNYVNFWKNTPIETILNSHVNIKKAPIGGTSAGMAILGSSYFSAENGTVSSVEALANPFNTKVTLGHNDFLSLPFLQSVITDTHYDNPVRKGRHVAFLARMTVNSGFRAYGIACEEFTAVCFDATGKAIVFGNSPASDDVAYFLQTNCVAPFAPENCTDGNPLHWIRNNQAIKVYAVKGTQTASNFFQLSDWKTGSGGEWEHWYVSSGVLSTVTGTASVCDVATNVTERTLPPFRIFPNPVKEKISVEGLHSLHPYRYRIINLTGRQMITGRWKTAEPKQINVHSLAAGVYTLQIFSDKQYSSVQFTIPE
jgi:cyanophycinase-like exopeptidase